jgi:hypothetical protein
MATSEDPAYFSKHAATIGPEWQRLVDEVLRLHDLEDDWDGDGAAAPDHQCVDAAMRWVLEMASAGEDAVPPTRISVTPAGELLVLWQTNSEYLEAEIVSPTEVDWMRCEEGRAAEHWSSGLGESVKHR